MAYSWGYLAKRNLLNLLCVFHCSLSSSKIYLVAFCLAFLLIFPTMGQKVEIVFNKLSKV